MSITESKWFLGARPRTLPAAIAPVLVGTSIAKYEGAFNPLIALLAMIVALAMQVGVNYANDYSDGIRGTDEIRVGPVRLVGQGLAEPQEVKRAAFYAFGLAALAGLGMLALSNYWPLLPAGLLAVVAGWFYTGGKNPYGYLGLGELFVFVFFGLVAVVGTAAAQIGFIDAWSLLGGVACGALSCALLVVNNLRDIPGDSRVGKRTLAVRLGDSNTRGLYRILLAVALIIPAFMSFSFGGPNFAFIACGMVLSARRPLLALHNGAKGADLVPVLSDTARLLLLYAMTLSMGILLSAPPTN